jgi:phosphohistidine phosphatase SixA
MRLLLSILAWLVGLTVVFSSAFAVPQARAADVIAAIDGLRQGGFVIFFRHGETGRVSFDRPTAVMGDCSTQRNLDDIGRAQVRQLGEDFKSLRIPVGKVLSSEFCRCWQHAEAMFGKGGYTITDKLSMPPSFPGVTEADRKKNNVDLAAMLSEKPAAGTNTVLVSHGNNILLLTGEDLRTQGEAVIFRPDGTGGYTRVFSVMPDEWTRASSVIPSRR